LGSLVEAVGEALGREFLDIEVDIDPSDGRLLAYLSAKGEVLSREYSEALVTVHVRMPTGAMGPVHRSALAIRPAGFAAEHQQPLPVDEPAAGVPAIPVSDPSSEVA
jgi:GTP-binding protein HflX